MGRLLAKEKYRDLLLGFALLCSTLALIAWPGEGVAAARDGLALCANVIVPSLFPFFVLSSLVVELGMSRYLGRLLEPIMAPLFRVGGACASALALGFVGGYPVGARTAISLYQNGQCSKAETERLLAFCNNSGPAFILGVVGAGVFSSSRAGLLLYLTHILASLLVGLLFRFYKPSQRPTPCVAQGRFQAVSFPAAFTKSVSGAMTATLNICAFVLFFTVAIRMLFLSGLMDRAAELVAMVLAPLGVSQFWSQRLLTGLLEISSGVSSLSGGGMTAGGLSMAAFMLGWAGLSVHCQVLAFLGDSGLSMRTYLVGKLLHGGLSALLISVLVRCFPLSVPVSTCLAEQVESLAGLDFQRALVISASAAWWVWLAFVALAVWAVKRSCRPPLAQAKKSGGKRRRGVV